MITDKPTVSKIIKITCVFMLVIFIFTSCVSKKDEKLPFMAVTSKDAETIETEISEIRVVIGRNESLEIIAAAEELCEQLTATVGKRAYISYEGDITAADGATEIWLGYGSNAVARSQMRDMRADDFMCREVGGAIVMGGRSSVATVNAIKRFCREILPSSTKYRLIPENGGFDHVGEYEFDKVVINGVSVESFEIVIESRNDESLLGAALYLQENISDKTGYWLDITEESERSFESNGIFLKQQSGQVSGVGRVVSTQYGFELAAEDYIGLIRCVDAFVGLFRQETEERTLRMVIDREIRTEYFSADFRVASMRADKYPPFADPETLALLLKDALDSRPDIFFTGKLSEEDSAIVLKNLQGYYAIKDKNGNVYGFAKSILCSFMQVTEDSCITKEYYTVEQDGVKLLLVRIGGSPADPSEYSDVLQLALEGGNPAAVISHTNNQSVSERLPKEFVKKYSESINFKNENYYFECYTAGTEFSEVDLNQNYTDHGYREIRISITA